MLNSGIGLRSMVERMKMIGGNLIIEKGSVFNTKEAVIQVKGGFPTITVDDATFISENGHILQVMENDDPNKSGGGGSAPVGAEGGGMPAGGAPSGGVPGAGTPDGSRGSMGSGPSGGAPGGMPGTEGGGPFAGDQSDMPGGPGGGSSAVTATFRNMIMNGDIVNSMTSLGDVVVNFENATITGAITTATAEHAVGPNGEELVMKEEVDLYYLIGDIKETYCATDDRYGVSVSLDSGSTWIVNETSFLTELTVAEGSVIIAPKDYKVVMTVDGVAKTIAPGTFKGKITITVSKTS
jgi:hypothetical protein